MYKPTTKQSDVKQTTKQKQSEDQIIISDPMLRRLDINVIDDEYVPKKQTHSSNDSSSRIETITTSKKIIKEQSINNKADVTAEYIQKQKSTTENNISTTNSNTNTTLSPLKLKCPNTNYEFERDWKTCKKRSDETLYQYLQVIFIYINFM